MMKFLLTITIALFVTFSVLYAQEPIVTISQASADTFALQGMPLQPILKIKINNPSEYSMTIDKLVVKSLNEDNLDIDSLALFYTVKNRFSLADYSSDVQTMIGSKKVLTGDTVVFSGFSFALDPGDNYIWITMDLNKNARPGHKLDASIRAGGMLIDGSPYPATLQSPNGNVSIRNVYYKCNFEEYDGNNKPKNWEQEPETGAGTWYGYYGGFGVTSPDNLYSPRIHHSDGHPGEPKSGRGNLTLKLQSTTPKNNLLISPPVDLSLATKPNLIFYHSQVERCKNEECTEAVNDELEVYYQVGGTNPSGWTLLNSYPHATDNSWHKREKLLSAVAGLKNVYFGFKGTTRDGWGICLDSIVIHEVGTSNRTVKTVEVICPTSDFIAQGTNKNPILRTNIRVSGNDISIQLTSIAFTTKNQDDNDIVPGSIRLYNTPDSLFFSPTQVGTTQSISGGKATFSGLSQTIETGDNYFWVTYDINSDATPDDTLAASISVNDIILSSGTYPASTLTPLGSRKIKQTIFFDDFETNKGWDLSVGDFQRQAPLGKGGDKGRPDPTYPYDGTNVLGNDLSGIGSFPGDFEPNSRSLAVSPIISGKYFKNIHLNFARWLNVENTDSACVQFKYTDSNKWDSIWLNTSTIVDTKWQQHSFDLTKKIIRKDFNLRFRLGTTNSLANYSGWNIDYLFITGDSIKYDASATKILSPLTSCDLSSSEKIKVRIKNTGPKPISYFPIKISKDGGKTYVSETVANTIAKGDSLDYITTTTLDFSKPAIYNLWVVTSHPSDNYPDNDTIKLKVLALPTYNLPYHTGYEEDTVFWTAGGLFSSWKLGAPGSNYINSTGEGMFSWKTQNLTGKYNSYENSYVESPCYSFSSNSIPIVDFKSSFYAENKYDGAILQYSLDGGTSWNYIPKDSYSFNWNWYTDTIKAFKGKAGWTNRSADLGGNQLWIREQQVLPLATIGPKVKFRIAFKSDSTSMATLDGFAFDDFKLYNAPYDLGVTSIDNLVSSGCQFGPFSNPDKIKVTVKNFGIRDVQLNDSIFIGIKVNNQPLIADTIKVLSVLAKGDSRQFTISKPIDLNHVGNYTIKAFTRNEKDPNFYGPGRGGVNDTSSIDIEVNPNPVPGLTDTVYTNRPNKTIIHATDSSYFNYDWAHPQTSYSLSGYEPDLHVKDTGLGRHRLTITNTNTGCTTKDSTFVKLLISDVGLSQIIKPITNCGYGTSMNPIVVIKNFGTDTLKTNDTIPVRLILDGGSVMKDTLFLTSKLDPGNTVQATLSEISLNLSTFGAHTIKAFTAYPADTTLKNDTIPVSYRSFQIHGYPTVNLGADTTVKKLSYTIRPKSQTGVTGYKWTDTNTTDSMVVTQSGKYLVTVTNTQLCETKDSINVRLKVHDIGVKRLVSPQNSCLPITSKYIIVQLMNFGTDTIESSESILMSFRVNDTEFHSQTFNLPAGTKLKPGDSISCASSKTFDLNNIATHKIMTKAQLANDIRSLNDSTIQMVTVFGNPKPVLPAKTIIRAKEYVLDPGIGFKSYLWKYGSNGSSTDSSFVITRYNNDSDNYKVIVTDANNCKDSTSTQITLQVYDLELSKLFLEDTCFSPESKHVAIKVTNKGHYAPLNNNDISIWYRINNGSKNIETKKINLADGATQTYDFDQKANIPTEGTYKITAGLIYGLDTDNSNDSIVLTINYFGYPSINIKDTLYGELPISIDAGSGAGYSYLWNTNETTQSISAATSGYYLVNVTNSTGCLSHKKVLVIGNTIDFAIDGFNSPLQNCTLTNSETIGLKIKNTGNITLSNQTITLKYKLDGGVEKTKEVVFNGAPGVSLSYNFDAKEDLSAVKSYTFSTSLVSASDKVSTNNSKDYTVVVSGLPQINDFGATNDTIKLNSWPKVLDAGAGFKTYKWQDGSANQTFSATTKGIYAVTVTDNNNCTANKSVYILHTSIRKISDQAEMTVYPNPVRDILYVKLNLKKSEAIIVQIVSANGKLVYSRKLNGLSEYLEQFDVYALPRGIYYIRVSTNDWVVTDKVLFE